MFSIQYPSNILEKFNLHKSEGLPRLPNTLKRPIIHSNFAQSITLLLTGNSLVLEQTTQCTDKGKEE